LLQRANFGAAADIDIQTSHRFGGARRAGTMCRHRGFETIAGATATNLPPLCANSSAIARRCAPDGHAG
jgi:hypothetical protein